MQVAQTQFYGDYNNQRSRLRKYHILNIDLSYCGKYLDPKDLKDGSIIFSKRYFKNNKWNKNIVCGSCLKSYIAVCFKDINF